jgi:brefeldin A-resistance guanine nucleotide exchange factor 1
MSSSLSDDTPSSPAHDVHNTSARNVPRAIDVAVDPVALVVTECITVTAAMRKHSRWAHSSVAAILGASTRTPVIQKRDRAGQGLANAGEPEDAVPSRWGLRGKKGKSMQDNPLMAAFARLRNDLKGYRGGYIVELQPSQFC